ncbi:MAG: 30S ribosomal protein S9 [Candidatus Omnitrophica bacterium]|nr:30S ribosomal protein S9 [Candidatus Omnitrophota bacterium]MBI2174462.1 30S ribosomal protein S9 [Candidatus Omnitrophota bacterium]MBI3009928.1 30S ribosomal protein S9 [Candidatus Omnitrophota bacterium]
MENENPDLTASTEPSAPVVETPVQKQAQTTSKSPVNAPWGTGRRKESVARVRLMPGSGAIVVNNRSCDVYFPRETLRLAIRSPLLLTHQLGKVDVAVTVQGGGTSGQAGAIKLGIARALVRQDPAHRPVLREAGLLTRDPREKERKKYGLKSARKRFQWTKR